MIPIGFLIIIYSLLLFKVFLLSLAAITLIKTRKINIDTYKTMSFKKKKVDMDLTIKKLVIDNNSCIIARNLRRQFWLEQS